MRLSILILVFAIFVGCSQHKGPSNVSNVSSNRPEAPPPALKASPQSSDTPVVDKKVVDEVKRIVGMILGVDAKTIDANVPLSKQKIPADELDVVAIIIEVEESFKIEIKDDELGGSDMSKVTAITVNEIAELVNSKQKAKKPAFK